MGIPRNEFVKLERIISSIIHNTFGKVCMEVEDKGQNSIVVKVWDKPMACVDKKLNVEKEFKYTNVYDTVMDIEEYFY